MTSYDPMNSASESACTDPSPVMTGLEQRVLANNGRRETFWAGLALVFILVLSGVGIWLNQAPTPPEVSYLQLNAEQKALLTQLSSAASEIRFIAESAATPTDVSPLWPDIEQLQHYAVPPFAADAAAAGYRWQTPEPGCYIGIHPDATAQSASAGAIRSERHFMLLMGVNLHQAAKIYSRQTPLASDPCHLTEQWQYQLSEF